MYKKKTLFKDKIFVLRAIDPRFQESSNNLAFQSHQRVAKDVQERDRLSFLTLLFYILLNLPVGGGYRYPRIVTLVLI